MRPIVATIKKWRAGRDENWAIRANTMVPTVRYMIFVAIFILPYGIRLFDMYRIAARPFPVTNQPVELSLIEGGFFSPSTSVVQSTDRLMIGEKICCELVGFCGHSVFLIYFSSFAAAAVNS